MILTDDIINELKENVMDTIEGCCITLKSLYQVMNNFGIKIEIIDIELYRQALTHKSYIEKEFYNKNLKELIKYKKEMPNVLDLRDESNERLEFFGDTIIKAIISEYLYERYPTQDEGFMTKLKTKIENRESLARWAKIVGLDKFVIIISLLIDYK